MGKPKMGREARGGEEGRSCSRSLWAAVSTPAFSPHLCPLFLPGAVGVGFSVSIVGSPEKRKRSFCACEPDGDGHLYLENSLDVRAVCIWKID